MKKSKFDMVYESIKEDLKKRLFMEDNETKQEGAVLEDNVATEEDEEKSENPELVKEFLDNMEINAQGAASGNNIDAHDAMSGNDIKIPAM